MTDEQTPTEKTPTTPDPIETPATPDASETAEISATSTSSETPATPEASETAVPAEASEPTEPAASAEQAEEAGSGVMHDPDHTPETAPAAEATQPIPPAAAAAAPPVGPPERPIFESEPERPRRGLSGRTAAIAGVIAAAALLGGGVGAALTTAVDSPETVTTTVERDAGATTAAAEPASRSGDLTVAELYRQASPSVVEISVGSSGGGEGQGGQGSGFVLDSEGHIVTNHHVVEGADSIRVTFSDGSSYDAELVGTDPSTDLAVIAVDAPADVLEPVELGDSDALEVGEEVVAMGSPYGLQETVTTGIVSALHRQITAPNGYAIGDAIQTDAAINPGNSGGPLLNLRGDVVGVNSQIETGGGGNDGVGFAVPSNTVESIAAQLIEDGSVEHAYLGVTVETIPEDVAGDIGEAAGVALVEVRAGTPAAEADLQGATGEDTAGGRPYPSGGDVVTEIDGEGVTTAEDLQARIDAKQPGDKLELTVVRDGTTRTVTVELGTRPD